MNPAAAVAGPSTPWSATRASEARLANGMQVVVIEDSRAPVVTHMVWYRVGRADEPAGRSGIAHFLEHLMFKSTDRIAVGEFSKIIARLGGIDNAFTSQDVTAYFQRVHKHRLATVMEMEADRMVNLRLSDQEVATERDVILEERRQAVEARPSAILDEQMDAALYLAHPYGTPIIGWEHEIERLDRQAAFEIYSRFYAPNNAILVVTGDVTLDEVVKAAEATYGRIPANPEVSARPRSAEPPHRAARRLELRDPRAGRSTLHRYYLVPSYNSASPGEAEALDLFVKTLAGGGTCRLYRRLVIEQKVAASAGGWYASYGRDSGKIGLAAAAASGVGLDRVEAALDAVIAEIVREGVTADELERARAQYLAEYVYQSDNQEALARRYGWGLAVGQTVADIEGWPERLARVTLDDVRTAGRHLDIRRSVTGLMLPLPPTAAAAPSPAAVASLA